MPKLVFIISLPRSGSTLMQRLLMADGRFASIGEPSLLLRFLGGDDVVQRRATYGENLVEKALADLRAAYPAFQDAYNKAVSRFAGEIYEFLSEGKPWFVDKTPRYHLICEDLIQAFPDAKYILIWRHPLAIAASISSSFLKNHWKLGRFYIDLYTGMERLASFARKHGDGVCQIRYEDLVSEPEKTSERIGSYLGCGGLERAAGMTLPHCSGTLGDRSGPQRYPFISAGSRDVWVEAYRNWFRRRWAASYFKGDVSEKMEALGYEMPARDSLPDMNRWRDALEGLKEWWLNERYKCRIMLRPLRGGSRFRRKHGYPQIFR